MSPGISGNLSRLTPGMPPVLDSKLYLALSNPFARHFYVNSGGGASAFQAIGASDGNDGLSWLTPLATIDAAFGSNYAVANRGDVIHVAQGHVETVIAAGGLDLDIAGVTIVGYGNGNLRPQINFTTDAGADMDVDAANIAMINFRFTGGITALTGPIDVNAADFSLINIVTEDVTGEILDCIVTDANADRMLIDGWHHRGAAGANAQSALQIVGGDDLSIQNFQIDGNFAVAAIENVSTACVNANIGALSPLNLIRTRNAADIIIACVSTATGWVDNLLMRLQDDAANVTQCLPESAGSNFQFGINLHVVNADGERGLIYNGAATIDI